MLKNTSLQTEVTIAIGLAVIAMIVIWGRFVNSVYTKERALSNIRSSMVMVGSSTK